LSQWHDILGQKPNQPVAVALTLRRSALRVIDKNTLRRWGWIAGGATWAKFQPALLLASLLYCQQPFGDCALPQLNFRVASLH